jgi:phosphate transport system protein
MRTRHEYHQHLRGLARGVVSLGSAVWDNIGRATEALVSYDLGLVDDVVEADDRIDEISQQLTSDAVLLLAREAPVASELSYVVSLLRLAYELERCGDLMVNVARVTYRLGGPVRNEQVRQGLVDLASRSRNIFEKALAIYDAGEVADLSEADDEVDAAQTRVFKALAEPGVDAQTIIALTIAARCFERVADHAVNLADRATLVVGSVSGSAAGSGGSAQTQVK